MEPRKLSVFLEHSVLCVDDLLERYKSKLMKADERDQGVAQFRRNSRQVYYIQTNRCHSIKFSLLERMMEVNLKYKKPPTHHIN